MNATQNLDFQGINSAVLANPSYLEKRLPNARREGHELVAGDIQGNPGKSFKLNLESGQWADFATAESGSDTVSFVAAQEGVGQGEAARLISDELGLSAPAVLARKDKALPECPAHDDNLVAHYCYRDVDASELFYVLRYEKTGYRKTIRQGVCRDGKIIFKAKDVKKVPYNLASNLAGTPAILDSQLVIVVEGENKVEALVKAGLCATCNPGGAGKWRDEYSAYLKGKTVIILPDNDRAGRDHANAVAKSLEAVAASVKIVELPGLPDKGDIIDWLKVPGNDIERLRAIMNDAPFLKPEKKEGLTVLNYGNLDTLQIAPRGHILYPVIPEQGLAMLFAPRGIGKTMLAMSIANAVAGGGALFSDKNGPAWFAPVARRVLYIDGEMPLHAMQSRQRAIAKGLPYPIPHDNLCFINPDVQPDFQMPKLATKAGQALLDTVLDGFEFIIIDNLATLCSNGRENDTDSWLPVQEWLLQLRRRGISVLVVHHAGKNGEQRGTSAKEDVLDTVIKLKRPDDYMSEDGARFVVELTKARGLCGPEANPFEASVMTDNESLNWTTKDIGNHELDAVRELLKEGKTTRQIAQELELSKSKAARLAKAVKDGV